MFCVPLEYIRMKGTSRFFFSILGIAPDTLHVLVLLIAFSRYFFMTLSIMMRGYWFLSRTCYKFLRSILNLAQGKKAMKSHVYAPTLNFINLVFESLLINVTHKRKSICELVKSNLYKSHQYIIYLSIWPLLCSFGFHLLNSVLLSFSISDILWQVGFLDINGIFNS